MSAGNIHRALTEAGAKRLSPDYSVWELSRPWWPFSGRARRFESLRLEILEAAASLQGPLFLVIDANPQEFDVGGSWAHARAGTWKVPTDCELEALRSRVLEAGDWSLYSSYEPFPPERIPDAFHVHPSEVASFALAHGVPLLVQAFHDNDPWRLWVEDMRSQQQQAA